MKKQLLFIGFCLTFSVFSFGQSNHEVPAAVRKSKNLVELSDKIHAKEASVATVSRSGATTIRTELKDLYTSYSAAISEQIRYTTSESELRELSQELRYADKRKAELTSTNR